jgi:hypothetical protein
MNFLSEINISQCVFKLILTIFLCFTAFCGEFADVRLVYNKSSVQSFVDRFYICSLFIFLRGKKNRKS